MKQEEARTKWCPMVRLASHASFEQFCTANRTMDGQFLSGCTCLASDRMMWLWLSKEEGLGCCGLAKA